MAQQSDGSPVSSLSRSWRATLARGLRRLANRLLTPSQPPPSLSVPVPAGSLAAQQARARSVLAEASATMSSLMTEPAVPREAAIAVAHLPGEAVELRQALRAYTDRLERLLARSEDERDELREHVRRLSDEVQSLRNEVAGLRASLAPPDAVAALPEPEPESSSALKQNGTEQPPPAPSIPDECTLDHTQDIMGEPGGQRRETAGLPPEEQAEGTDGAGSAGVAVGTVEAAAGSGVATVPTGEIGDLEATTAHQTEEPPPGQLDDSGGETHAAPITREEVENDEDRLSRKVFPAGTIGVVLALAPVESFAGLAALQARLGEEAGVEHVELLHYEGGEARLHLNFRPAMEGSRLRAAVARAAGLDALDLRCTWEGRIVRVRLLRAVSLSSGEIA